MAQRFADHDGFPTAQLFLLAVCRLAEPIALTSVFPYAFRLVKDFEACDDSDASLFAGLFISAFALAESLTGMYWGGLSDRVGRKPVLLLGCAGTLLSLLVVGFSTNIWMAVLGRALGGFLNGNVGVIQTMVGELVEKPEHEPRAYAVMPFIWSLGTIIGPAIGGTFADPVHAFPHLFASDGLFAVFPFLLPNLICATLLLVSIVLAYRFLDETHPEMQASAPAFIDEGTVETPLLATAGANDHCAVDLRAESYGTFNAVNMSPSRTCAVRADGLGQAGAGSGLDSAAAAAEVSPLSPTTFSRRVIMVMVALGIFTYHSMTYDHLLPIFLQDERRVLHPASAASPFDLAGGLGLSLRQVGYVMSVNGLIALFIQAVVFPLAAGCLGVWRLFVLTALLHPLVYFVVPYLALLPASWLFGGIYGALSLRNLFSIVAYPVMLILLKEASPSASVLGRINGLAASAGAACRTLAPPLSGYLYAVGARHGFSGLAWWASGAVAALGAAQCWFVERERHRTTQVQCLTNNLTGAGQADKNEVVYIQVDEAECGLEL